MTTMRLRQHDTQRSAVYAWERAVALVDRRDLYTATWDSLDDVRAWAEPIWRKERGRYGRAGKAVPAIERPHRGQRSAIAHYDGRITLPRWARSPWVVLHEMAHHLAFGDRHGPRFVGVLIGLAARHLGHDACELMRLADEGCVKYSVRSIGVVSVFGLQERALKALATEGPMSPMDLACWLSIGTAYDAATVTQIRAALLWPVRRGQVRLVRGLYRLDAQSSLATLPMRAAAQTEDA